MVSQIYDLDIISPCFCAGALPDENAEIRAASIRGQLRWWFRVLGGFSSLAAKGIGLRQQEAEIFGSAAGGEGSAGKLSVRVLGESGKALDESEHYPAPKKEDPKSYFLFPLDKKDRHSSTLTGFTLQLSWRGSEDLAEDIAALTAVFGHLGALGFRARRAMGALAFREFPYPLPEAIQRFSAPDAIQVFEVTGGQLTNTDQCIKRLATWLRDWRSHGQMHQSWRWVDTNRPPDKRLERRLDTTKITPATKQQNRERPGFKFARRDHNEGLDVLSHPTGSLPASAAATDPEKPAGSPGTTFRPALGLPIVQKFSSLGNAKGPARPDTVTWNFTQDGGRFASPVILRPHRSAENTWHAYVIFIESRKWPTNPVGGSPHPVFLGTVSRQVSLELYEKMKKPDSKNPVTQVYPET